MPWLPGGAGHVLITTRTSGWEEIAARPVEVDVFARPESSRSCASASGGWPRPTLTRWRPNSVTCRWRSPRPPATWPSRACPPPSTWTWCTPAPHGSLIRAGPVLPGTLAGAIQLTTERLAATTLPPPSSPRSARSSHPSPSRSRCSPPPLASCRSRWHCSAADMLTWRQSLDALGRSSLARIDQHSLQMHRLTQAILRDRLAPGQADAIRALAGTILTATIPATRIPRHLARLGGPDAAHPGHRPRRQRRPWLSATWLSRRPGTC